MLETMTQSEQLKAYCKYYHKSPFKLKHCDSRATSLESLYEIGLKSRTRINFFPSMVDQCLNDSCNIVNAIRTKEHNIIYVTEGLIKTYPIETVIKTYQKWFDTNISSNLKDKKLSDVVEKHEYLKDLYDKFDNKIKDIVDYQKFSDNTTQPGLVTFCIPFTEDQLDTEPVEDRIKQLAHVLYKCGYNLAQYELIELDEDMLKDDFYDVVFFYATFEAKYTNIDFKLSKHLYHVTPISTLKKICRQGLVPKASNSVYNYPERVYLFNDCDMSFILDYAMEKADSRNDEQFVLIQISSDNLQNDAAYKNGKLKLYVDQKYFVGENGLPQAVYTYQNINRKLLGDEIVIFTFKNYQILDKQRRRLSDFS